jgi:hypothetical protein
MWKNPNRCQTTSPSVATGRFRFGRFLNFPPLVGKSESLLPWVDGLLEGGYSNGRVAIPIGDATKAASAIETGRGPPVALHQDPGDQWELDRQPGWLRSRFCHLNWPRPGLAPCGRPRLPSLRGEESDWNGPRRAYGGRWCGQHAKSTPSQQGPHDRRRPRRSLFGSS